MIDIWEAYYTFKTREMYKLENSTCLKVQNLFDVKKHVTSRSRKNLNSVDTKLGRMAEESFEEIARH